jgi:hypothetical protein
MVINLMEQQHWIKLSGTNFGGTGVSSTTANFVFAGPESGSTTGAPVFRKLVACRLACGQVVVILPIVQPNNLVQTLTLVDLV